MKLVSLFDGVKQAKADRENRDVHQGVRAIDDNVVMLLINNHIIVWHKITLTKAERIIFHSGESYMYETTDWDEIFDALVD